MGTPAHDGSGDGALDDGLGGVCMVMVILTNPELIEVKLDLSSSRLLNRELNESIMDCFSTNLDSQSSTLTVTP